MTYKRYRAGCMAFYLAVDLVNDLVRRPALEWRAAGPAEERRMRWKHRLGLATRRSQDRMADGLNGVRADRQKL